MTWLKMDVLNSNPLNRRAAWGFLLAAVACAPAALEADVGDGQTIASGLSNPRGIAFAPNRALYVVEGGRGGSGPCILSPVQPPPPAPARLRCFGLTGAVTKILPGGGFQRIVSGLPSMVLADGTSEGGPSKLSFQGTAAYVTMGMGGDPAAVRAALGGQGDLFGTLLRVTPSGQYQVVGDIAAHETALNPAGGTVELEPVWRARTGGPARGCRRRCERADRGARRWRHAHARRTSRTRGRTPGCANFGDRGPGWRALCRIADRLPVLPGQCVSAAHRK